MEIEISGLMLRVAVQFCVAASGLLLLLCGLAALTPDGKRRR